MNSKSFAVLFSLSLAWFLGGCSSTPSTPKVVYPVTYQIQVGNTQVHSDYGPQVLNVSASQQVVAPVGQPLYFQVVSPVDVTVYVYERGSANSRKQISTMQGKSFTSSITPSVSTLEFAFAASEPNSSAKVMFTLSDRPITPVTP